MSTGKPVQLNRSHIDISDAIQVRFWLKHLGVSREQLQSAVEKVGNAAAAVRKELATRNPAEPRESIRAEVLREYPALRGGEGEKSESK